MSLKILYIAGAGRSGSLLLNNILGTVENFFSCGEIYNLYRTPLAQRYCSCGRILSKCEVWQSILEQATQGDPVNWQRWMLRSRNRFARTRYFPLWLVPQTRHRLLRLSAEYLKQLEQLYMSIARVTQARVIVDASKVATYLALLFHLPSLEVRAIHLTRDARAVAYSWHRKKRVDTPGGVIETPTASLLLGTWRWAAHNLAVETCLLRLHIPHIRLQYEELIRAPKESISAILRFIGEEVDLARIRTYDRIVEVKTQHNVGGNPARFQAGQVSLQLDDEWREKMPLAHRTIVTLLAAPLLRRYGYL